MLDLIIDRFRGIAPRQGNNLPPGFAVTAENCDLFSGKLRPLKNDLLVEAATASHNSMAYCEGAWRTAVDAYFCRWRIDPALPELLIYLSSGSLIKRVGSDVATLGQVRGVAPTVTNIGGTGFTATGVCYITTTTRSVGGHIDESGPSDPSTSMGVDGDTIQITRPTLPDAFVTYWNIYRMSNESATYQLVAQVAAATATYDDSAEDSALGATPITWYTSSQGNSIIFDEPPTDMDGLCAEPHAGMLFAWKGSTIYWCEPGSPDGWPGFYNLNLPATIKNGLPFGGSLLLVTAGGPYHIDGSNAELLQPSQAIGSEPAISSAIARGNRGLYFVCDSGVAVCNLGECAVVSDTLIGEGWFKANVDPTGSVLVYNDGQLYLFHSAGVLILDQRDAADQLWFTLDIVATAAAVREDTGDLYIIKAGSIYQLGGATTDRTWTWQSGDLLLGVTDFKAFPPCLVNGSDEVTVTLYVDGAQVATKALVLDRMVRDRTLGVPEQSKGRALQVKLYGTGNVDDVTVAEAA